MKRSPDPHLPETSPTVIDEPATTATPRAGVSRRTVLKSAAAAGAVGLAASPIFRVAETAVAASNPTTARVPDVGPERPGRLVLVFLRGAADHLSMTVPLDEANYQDARPGIAIDPNRALQLDDRFGFHPAMPRLHERYQDGQLAPLVAVGNPAGDRSHFVSQDLHERGSDGTDAPGNGWLARHLAAASAPGNALRAITVGSNVDASLLGARAIGMTSLRSFGLAGAGRDGDILSDVLRRAHDGGSALDVTALQALVAATAVGELPASTARDREVASFEDIATLLEADLGTEVITTSIDGWDTHSRMGDSDAGEMRNLLGGLDDLVAGLADSLDDRGIDDVTTVVVTEFGRRVAENGSGGCDHGWASAALVLGAAANGGRVHGDWPGLEPDVIADTRGDVPMTTDYRDLLGDVVTHVLGGDPSIAFPDHAARPTGVVTST